MSSAALQQVFREYMMLERKRAKGAGLSPDELKSWAQYKSLLSKRLQPDVEETDACRRNSLRVPVRLDVSFETSGEVRESLMTNLSRGGLFVSTDAPLEMGTKVELRIAIGDVDRPIDVMTEVVCVNLGRDLKTSTPGMGLRFIDMDPAKEAMIGQLYEKSASRALEKLSGESA